MSNFTFGHVIYRRVGEGWGGYSYIHLRGAPALAGRSNQQQLPQLMCRASSHVVLTYLELRETPIETSAGLYGPANHCAGDN